MSDRETSEKHHTGDRTPTRFRRSGAVVAAVLLVVGCGGSDEATTDSASGDSPTGELPAPDPAQPTDGGATLEEESDAGTDTRSESSGDAESDGKTELDVGTKPDASAGTGTIPGDLCADGAPLSGAITLDDFVEFGILSTADASVDGTGAIDAVAYNDFGILCNIEDADGDFFTIGMSSGAGTFEQSVEQSGAPATQAGEWQYLIGQGITQLVMLHTDVDGNENTVFVNWFPDDDSRRSAESVAVMAPLAEAILERSNVEVPMIDVPGTPPWFACNDSAPGVAGLDPAVVMAAVGVPDGAELETDEDVRASFGNTQCTTRSTAQNFPFVRFDVQAADAQLAETVDTYLAGWSDATAETIAGRDVAIRVDSDFGEAFVFVVIDGFPTTVQLGVTGFDGDLGDAARTIAGEFFDAIE